jgi:hypothetical protein
MEEYTELQHVPLKLHERCEAVSRSNGGMGKRSLRRDWENQANRTAPIERAFAYWTQSSHLHTGPRRVKSRTLRPDTHQHLTTCSPKERVCLHLPGRPHTSGLRRLTRRHLLSNDARLDLIGRGPHGSKSENVTRFKRTPLGTWRA